jgi:hypothetical protein
VIAEAADVLSRYGAKRVRVDRFAGMFPIEQFRKHGIEAETAERSTSDTYLELLPLVNAREALLLDDDKLLRELRGLERRRGTAGRDRVDHRPGSHDDRAAACAGALVAASARRKRMYMSVWSPSKDRMVGPGYDEDAAEAEAKATPTETEAEAMHRRHGEAMKRLIEREEAAHRRAWQKHEEEIAKRGARIPWIGTR